MKIVFDQKLLARPTTVADVPRGIPFSMKDFPGIYMRIQDPNNSYFLYIGKPNGEIKLIVVSLSASLIAIKIVDSDLVQEIYTDSELVLRT